MKGGSRFCVSFEMALSYLKSGLSYKVKILEYFEKKVRLDTKPRRPRREAGIENLFNIIPLFLLLLNEFVCAFKT